MNRTLPPPIRKIENYQLMSPSKILADNEIPFYYFQNELLELLHFSIVVQAGFLYQEQNCVAATCYGVVRDHPRDMSTADFSALLDSLGASFSMATGLQSARLNLVVPKRNVQKVLAIVFDLLRNPCFDEESLNLRKERTLQDWKCNQLKPDARITELVFQHYFAEKTPMSIPLNETVIRRVTLQDIQAYYEKSFCAENITFYATGALDQNDISFIVSELSRFPKGRPLPQVSRLAPAPDLTQVFERKNNCCQSAVMLCKPFFNLTSDFLRRFNVVNTILGGYFGSRLMTNLRETNGFTYNAGSDLCRLPNEGILMLSADVGTQYTRQTIDECRKELKLLCETLVEEDEMNLVRNYLIGKELRSVDGSVAYMKQYINWHLYGGDESEFYKNLDTIETISSDDVKEMAMQYFVPESFSTFVVGEM